MSPATSMCGPCSPTVMLCVMFCVCLFFLLSCQLWCLINYDDDDRICDKDNLQNEVSEIYRIFTDLRYPEWFIHDAHMSARRTFFTTNRNKREKPKKCLVLPYNEGLKGFKRVCSKEGVGVAFTYPNTR